MFDIVSTLAAVHVKSEDAPPVVSPRTFVKSGHSIQSRARDNCDERETSVYEWVSTSRRRTEKAGERERYVRQIRLSKHTLREREKYYF